MKAGWKERLLEAIDADPRSDRRISLDAKLGPNFVSQTIRGKGKTERQQPGVDNVMKLAREVNLSLSKLFLGFDITPQEEELIHLLASADEEVQRSVLTILRRGSHPAGVEEREPEPQD